MHSLCRSDYYLSRLHYYGKGKRDRNRFESDVALLAMKDISKLPLDVIPTAQPTSASRGTRRKPKRRRMGLRLYHILLFLLILLLFFLAAFLFAWRFASRKEKRIVDKQAVGTEVSDITPSMIQSKTSSIPKRQSWLIESKQQSKRKTLKKSASTGQSSTPKRISPLLRSPTSSKKRK